MIPLEILSKIELITKEEDIPFFSITKVKSPIFFEKYKKIVNKLDPQTLPYLRKFKERENPENIFPEARSIISFIFPYFFDKKNVLNLEKNKIAQFARGEDYHKRIRKKLKKISKEISQNCKILCDSGPFLEKVYGFMGGLGFIGKNTLLINNIYGSAFNLGFILTDKELPEKFLNFKGNCGNCKRCIEVCPTGALEEPFFLNPSKCISYLTMEAKSIPSEPEERWGYIYGCDLCQAVCPFNENLKNENFKGFSIQRISEERMKKNIEIVEKEKMEVYIKQEEKYFPLNPALRTDLKKILKKGVYFFNGREFEGLDMERKFKLYSFFSKISLIDIKSPFEIFIN